ncbi:uncharacterized protein VP01_3087g4 [Puccinia sorghi]|uniref:Uncharacterized protein n=1 Tax=Puccinia sorghi TaxID=27349 RepID=A0A0L6UZL3_9BASI|nr:uncharacterized protein VP01_3087g4 [Puccinia sorghi]
MTILDFQLLSVAKITCQPESCPDRAGCGVTFTTTLEVWNYSLFSKGSLIHVLLFMITEVSLVRVGESDVIPKAWMFHSSRSIVGHPFTLENDQGRPVDLKKRLDRKNTITHVLDENLHSLSKRWFFGNEEAHGVTTIRSQLNSRNPTTPIGASNDAGGLPMVSLPSGKLAPLWNDSNLEKSDPNLSNERQRNGELDPVSTGLSASKTSSATSSGSDPLSPKIGDGDSSNPNRVVASTTKSQLDLMESAGQDIRSSTSGTGAKSSAENNPMKRPPPLWLIEIFCVALALAVFLFIALKQKRYQVSFKPFKIHKAPKPARAGESESIGRRPAAAQPFARSNKPQMTKAHTEEGFMSSEDPKHETFVSTMAEVGPNPALGAKEFPGKRLHRLRRFFQFKDSKFTKSSGTSCKTPTASRELEKSDASKHPLPDVYISPPDPVHQKANPPAGHQKLTNTTNRENRGLSIEAMSPIKNSPANLFNEYQRETVELHCIRRDQIEIHY